MSGPLTVTITSPTARKAMVDALRKLADQLESGELQHVEGGIIVDHDATTKRVKVTSDLVVAPDSAPTGAPR